MRRSQFAIWTLVLLSIPTTASAEYMHLCTSVPGACEHTGPSAPKLRAAVCYVPATMALTVKGTAPCPVSAMPFFLEYGEVLDPETGAVAAYLPLDDACAAGICAEYAPHDGGQEYTICCEDDGPCWPHGGCEGLLYWCYDGVCEEDGTITCFNAEEL